MSLISSTDPERSLSIQSPPSLIPNWEDMSQTVSWPKKEASLAQPGIYQLV